jgi:hypothetical protein
MLIRKLTTTAVAGLVTLISAGVASANDHTLNAKEINGQSRYISVAIANSDMNDVKFMERRSTRSSEMRNGKTVVFDDPDGIVGTLGHDYGYVRLETELGYRSADVSSMTGVNNAVYSGANGEVNIGTAFANLAIEYTIDPGELSGSVGSGFSITPYITAGGGVLGAHGNLNYDRIAIATITNGNEEIDEGFFIAPAVQGGAGVTIGLPYGVEVFGQYSEMLAYTYNYRDSSDIHIKTVSGGLRLNF